MNIRIIQTVLDVFDYYGESIRFDLERFEEAINDAAPDLIDECYLITLGMKTGIFDALIFSLEDDIRTYFDYLQKALQLNDQETLFMLSSMKMIVSQMGYNFEIPQFQNIVQFAYQREDDDYLLWIAKAYYYGFGVQQDYEKAYEVYVNLYQRGHEECAYYLGYMYEHGWGVEQNLEKAFLFYTSQPDSLCEYRLGILYLLGKYVEQDDQQAYEHFALSEEEEAYLYQGLLLERQRDYAGAFHAYQKGAYKFQKECLYKAGLFLKIGLGVQRNRETAYRYFEFGYFLCHGECTYQLALLLLDDLMIEKAIHYLKQAAELYSRDACLTLARFYEFGQYVMKDDQRALFYYHKASNMTEELQKVRNGYESI